MKHQGPKVKDNNKVAPVLVHKILSEDFELHRKDRDDFKRVDEKQRRAHSRTINSMKRGSRSR